MLPEGPPVYYSILQSFICRDPVHRTAVPASSLFYPVQRQEFFQTQVIFLDIYRRFFADVPEMPRLINNIRDLLLVLRIAENESVLLTVRVQPLERLRLFKDRRGLGRTVNIRDITAKSGLCSLVPGGRTILAASSSPYSSTFASNRDFCSS